MRRYWNIFLRVLRSYTIEEKVISVIVLGIVVFLGLQMLINTFSGHGVQDSGVYIEGIVSEKPTVLNPLFVDFSQADRDLSSLLFSGLTKYDPEKKAFVGDMADLAISEDRKIYTFTLKNNLKWHDGQPLTAEDVYFTFHDVIQNPEFQNQFLRMNFEGVEIKQMDDKTIQFILQKPNSFFITNTNVGIVPKHILGQVPVAEFLKDPFNLKPIGSGPYKIENQLEFFDDGRQRVNFIVFDDYYGEKSKIRHFKFNIYPDMSLLLKEKAGLDTVAKVPPANFNDFQAANRFVFFNYELPQYTALFFNMDRPVFKKEKVRVALLKSIDKTELLKVVPDKMAVDTPLLELNQSDWIYKPSLDEAKGGLFDSGYKIDQTDNLRKDSSGKVLELTLLARAHEEGTPLAEETMKVTDFLKKSWEQLGVKVDVYFASQDEFNNRLAMRDYDMVLTGQSLGYNLDTYSFWHSTQATSQGLNLSNYKSFAADQVIEKLRDTFDPAQKDLRLKDLAKVLASDVPAIFLYRPRYIFASDNKVKGFSLENLAFPSDRFAHIERWCSNCQ